MEYGLHRLWWLLVALVPVICVDSQHGLIILKDDADKDNLLLGPLYRLADFDECIIEHRAQYCYTELQIWKFNQSSEYWQNIQTLNAVKTNFRRDLLYSGVCVSRNMSASETQSVLLDLVTSSANSLGVQVRVQTPHCTTSDTRPWTWQDLLMGFHLILLLLLLISATALHQLRPALFKEHSEKRHPVLRGLFCFSLKKSWGSLTDMSRESVETVPGIRVMIMFSLLIGNYWLLVLRGPILHQEKVEEMYTSVMQMPMINGHVLIAMFFTLSGFMCCYNFLKQVETSDQSKIKIIIISCMKRYIRLTPCYALLILFVVSFLPRISTGPTWFATVESAQHNCLKYWWTNLLYINNYVGVENACLLHTWYLAADFQLYCVCLGLVAIISAYPRSAKYVLATGMLVALVIPFTQTYLVEEINATLLVTPETMRHLTTDATYQLSYITAQHNLGPYMIGIILGYFYIHVKNNNVKLKKIPMFILFFFSSKLPLVAILGAYLYYQPGDVSRLQAAFYNSLTHNVLSIGISAAIVLGAMGKGGMMNRLATSRPLIFVSRLSYCFFLVHFVVQTVDVGMTRRPVEPRLYEVMCRALATGLISFFIALKLHLAVEAPCHALRNLIFPDERGGKLKETMEGGCELLTDAMKPNAHAPAELGDATQSRL